MSTTNITQFITALKNSSLHPERKKYYGEKVNERGLTEEIRTELREELEDEIREIDEALEDLSDEKIQSAVQITQKANEEEALLEEMSDKIKKLERLKYEHDDKLAQIDEFYDPILQELVSEESKRKLQEEKNVKIAAIEAEFTKLAKEIESNSNFKNQNAK